MQTFEFFAIANPNLHASGSEFFCPAFVNSVDQTERRLVTNKEIDQVGRVDIFLFERRRTGESRQRRFHFFGNQSAIPRNEELVAVQVALVDLVRVRARERLVRRKDDDVVQVRERADFLLEQDAHVARIVSRALHDDDSSAIWRTARRQPPPRSPRFAQIYRRLFVFTVLHKTLAISKSLAENKIFFSLWTS